MTTIIPGVIALVIAGRLPRPARLQGAGPAAADRAADRLRGDGREPDRRDPRRARRRLTEVPAAILLKGQEGRADLTGDPAPRRRAMGQGELRRPAANVFTTCEPGPAQPAILVSTSQRAVRSRRASSPLRPTSCTPIGRPSAPLSSGSVTAGSPSSVQIVQNAGLPVLSSPRRRLPGRGRRQDHVVAREQRVERARAAPARGRARGHSRAPAPARPSSMIPRRRSDSCSRPRSYSAANERARSTPMISPCRPCAALKASGSSTSVRRGPSASASSAKAASQVVLGLVPDRAPDQREVGRHRPVLARDLEQARRRLEPRVAVAGIEAGERLGEQREVLDACARTAPRWSSGGDWVSTPKREIRPCDGLKPNTPQ